MVQIVNTAAKQAIVFIRFAGFAAAMGAADRPVREIQPRGQLKDVLTGAWRRDTPTERLRQRLIAILVDEYGYSPESLEIRISRRGQAPIEGDLFIVEEKKGGGHRERAIFFLRDEVTPDQLQIAAALKKDVGFAGWYNGTDFACFVAGETGLTRLSHIPRANETLDHFGHYRKRDLRPAHNLKLLFRRIHNHLYANSNIRVAGKLSNELIKILLCKITDELSTSPTCAFGITLRELETREGRGVCAARLQKLFREVVKGHPAVFSKEDRLELDDDSIAYVVGELEPFSLTATDVDAIAAAFEIFLGSNIKGEKGEFFTPKVVVSAAVDVVRAIRGDVTTAKMLDPAMGTAGFVSVYLNRLKVDQSHAGADHETLVAGIDVEVDQVRLGRSYLAILGHPNAEIFHADSLRPFEDWPKELKSRITPNSLDVILTNPPFGTRIPVTDERTLRQYAVAHRWTNSPSSARLEQFESGKRAMISEAKWTVVPGELQRNQVPDILFLERCVQLLSDEVGKEGVMGIVLPRQILSGDDKQYVRQWLLDHTRILAVIDLPVETFQPFTGTKTSLLFVQKGKARPGDAIFMAASEVVGHDRRGNPIFETTPEGDLIVTSNGDPIIANDLPALVEAFRAFQKTGSASAKNVVVVTHADVSFSTTNSWGRLDASFYVDDTAPELVLPRGWKTAKVADVAEVSYPGRFKRIYVDAAQGVPFLSGNDATQVEPADVKHVSYKTAHLDELMLSEGEILISRSGTVGNVIYVGSRFKGFAASEHLLRVRAREGAIDAGYLYAYLSSEQGIQAIKRGIYGSVVDEITPDYVGSLTVPLPPSELQAAIGNRVRAAERARFQALEEVRAARHELSAALKVEAAEKKLEKA